MHKKQLKREIQLQIGKDIYFKGTMGQLVLSTATISCGAGGVMGLVVFCLVRGLGV